jgi:hypothetical protein
MPSSEVGSEVFKNFALYCWPWVRSLIHSPDHRDEFAVTACFDPQNAETVLLVVVRDTLDEARQHLQVGRVRLRFHDNCRLTCGAAAGAQSLALRPEANCQSLY